MLEILDTAGQEDFVALRQHHIQQGQAFCLVYTVTSKRSFQIIGTLYNDILMIKEDTADYPVVVIGNKVDMVEGREVSSKDGQEFAKGIGAPFFECSAKTRYNVETSFEELVREVRKWKKRHENDNNSKKQVKKHERSKRCILM